MSRIILILLFLFINTFGAVATEYKFFGMSQAWLTYVQTTKAESHPGSPAENWGIRLRRSIIGIKAVMDEVFSYSFHLEFAYKDSPALDIFLNAAIDKYFNIRLGQFIPETQTKEGFIVPTELFFYEYSDIALKAASHSGFTALRDVGIQFSGGDELFRYSAYIGNGTGRFNYNNASQYIKNRKFGDGFYGARLDFFPLLNLRLGGHFGYNTQDSARLDDKVISYKRSIYSIGFSFHDYLTEGLFGEFEIAGGKAEDMTKDSSRFDYSGMYSTLGYKITKELHALCRYEQYSEIPELRKDIFARKVSLGISWYYYNENNDLIKLSLNYQIMNEVPDDINNNIIALLVQAKF